MPIDRLVELHLVVSDLEVIRGIEIDHGCMPVRRGKDGKIRLDGVTRHSTVAKLRAMIGHGVHAVRVREVAHDAMSHRGIVSAVNRYADGSLPCGLGRLRDGHVS